MPLPIMLAHRLVEKLTAIRKNGKISYLRPDGKSQVSVEYIGGKPARVDAVVVSTQHAPVSQAKLRKDVIAHVIKPVIPSHMIDSKTKIFVNPTGRFEIAGLGRHGPDGSKDYRGHLWRLWASWRGAFSGKDPSKVDRSAAYAARWVAKNIVAAGLADKCEVQISYAIGVRNPLRCWWILLERETTRGKITQLVRQIFDLKPRAIIKALNLRRPIFQKTSSYGHFGRNDKDFTWERTDRAAALRKAAGLK